MVDTIVQARLRQLVAGVYPTIPEPVNIVVLLMDDVGTEWFTVYDSTNRWAPGYAYPSTPFIDSIAAKGVVYTNARAASVCSPTRARFLTGRPPAITPSSTGTGIGFVVNKDSPAKLDASMYPIPHVLRAISPHYKSAAFGKWHLGLGQLDDRSPNVDGGFDHYTGCLTNPNIENSPTYTNTPGGYFEYWETVGDQSSSVQTYIDGTYDPGSGAIGNKSFMLTREHDAITAWLAARTEPFFAQWWAHSAHSIIEDMPDDAGPGGIQWARTMTNADQLPGATSVSDGGSVAWRRTRAHIEAMDRGLELAHAAIPTGPTVNRQAQTIYIIMGDNGSDNLGLTSYNDTWPGNVGGQQPPPGVYDTSHMKRTQYEGGTRIPLIIGGDPIPTQTRGTESDELVDVSDLYGLVLDLLANDWRRYLNSANELDIVEAEPMVLTLSNPSAHLERNFSFSERFEPNGATFANRTASEMSAVDRDRWKLIVYLDGTEELYDLTNDGDEQNDLISLINNGGQEQLHYTALRAYIDSRIA